MALPSSVIKIWWYWMKWRRKFLYLEKNYELSDVNDIYFNWEVIHRSQKYKYLGNLISKTQTIRGDIFRHTYEYLGNKATHALFSMNKKLSHLGALLPKLAMRLFKSNIEPILTYGCDVWGSIKRYWSDWQIFTTIPKNTFESKAIHEYYMANWVLYLLVLMHISRYYVIITVCVTCLVRN